MTNLVKPIDLAEYLFRRLQQCGVHSAHGVPGDYNLHALDYVQKIGMRWVGNVNELNAGYAADAYARLRHLSVLVTTFGVGELSAANAVAGSFAEHVPVIHIVGTPSTSSQKGGMLLHHTLGNGDFTVFSRMSKEITCASANLNDPDTAAEKVDNVIRRAVMESRPGYITLPTDMVTAKVEGERLKHKLDLSFPPNDSHREDFVVQEIVTALEASKRPCILVDACVLRHRAHTETIEFVRASKLPTFVTPMGKSAVDEDSPNFGGVYAGTASEPDVKKFVESSDLVLNIGGLQSDFNTAGFSVQLSNLHTIELHSFSVKARFAEFPNIRMNGVLKKLTEAVREGRLKPAGQIADTDSLALKLSPKLGPVGPLASLAEKSNKNEIPPPSTAQKMMASLGKLPESGIVTNPDAVTHDYLWPRLSAWLQPDDVIVSETGTSNFGIWSTRFPPGVRAVNQVLWGSIGYATGACLGAALAIDDDKIETAASELVRPPSTVHKQPGKARTVLFTGDGSFQLSVQEVGTALRHGLAPIIFLIQNKGYTIERFIHGVKAEYNDVAEWDYTKIPAVFGADVRMQLPSSLSSVASRAQAGTERLDKAFKSLWKSDSRDSSGAPMAENPDGSLEREYAGRTKDGEPANAKSGPKMGAAKVWRIKTRTELEALLNDETEWKENKYLRLIELHMPWDDAPQTLVETAQCTAKLNAKQSG